jgi:hypothetical protein
MEFPRELTPADWLRAGATSPYSVEGRAAAAVLRPHVHDGCESLRWRDQRRSCSVPGNTEEQQ